MFMHVCFCRENVQVGCKVQRWQCLSLRKTEIHAHTSKKILQSVKYVSTYIFSEFYICWVAQPIYECLCRLLSPLESPAFTGHLTEPMQNIHRDIFSGCDTHTKWPRRKSHSPPEYHAIRSQIAFFMAATSVGLNGSFTIVIFTLD